MAWMKQILGGDRERRQWIEGNDAKEVRENAAKLRKRVLEFKAEMRAKQIGFRTDRDAWMEFWRRNPHAHMEFAGTSADQALGEHAFRQFKSIWNRETKVVRFEGDGTEAEAPTAVTLGEGESRVRTNVLEALKLEDPEDRARAITALGKERRRLQKDIKGRLKRLRYLNKVHGALESGAIAIEDPVTGEVIVQGLLPEAGPGDVIPLGDVMLDEDTGDDDAE